MFIGHCHGHIRNFIIKGMMNAATEKLKLLLEDDLSEFSSFERMSVNAMDLILAAYKEFHPGGAYAKGKGREFLAWVKAHFPKEMWIPILRAAGSRQDMSFDGAVPLFADRKILMEFLRSLLVPGSDNTLESFLYGVLRCNEMVALLRVLTLFDLVWSRPMRFLNGAASSLDDWGSDNSAEVLDLTEKMMVAIAADGHALLDPSLDPCAASTLTPNPNPHPNPHPHPNPNPNPHPHPNPHPNPNPNPNPHPNPNPTLRFGSITEKQPRFRKWRAEMAQRVIKSPDGSTAHQVYERVLAEARQPADAGNKQATAMVVELAEAMANAALVVMRDPKRACAEYLTSQDGARAMGNVSTAEHEATVGSNQTNDHVESNYGVYDYCSRIFRNACAASLSGLTQQARAHDFDAPANVAHDRRKKKAADGDDAPAEGGFFFTLTKELQESLVEYTRRAAAGARADGRVELKEHDDAKLLRREERLTTLLNHAVDNYVYALELFDAWQASRAKSKDEVATVLRGKPEAQQLEYLRKQIEMRVLGLGWTKFATRWSSNKNARIGTVEHLTELLNEIILEEISLARLKRLPTEAAPPQDRLRELKQLGTLDADAAALEGKALFSVEELRAKAEQERQRRLAAGISDHVEDLNPDLVPPFDQALVGKWIEILWPYTVKDGAEKGEKKLIWATGRVVRIADGLTDKRSKRAQKLLPAGAGLWAWEADPEFEEAAGEQWLMLLPKKWKQHQVYGWRYDPRELVAQGVAPQAAAGGTPERPRARRG